MARQISNRQAPKATPQQAADAVIAQMYGYFAADALRPQPVLNEYQPPLAA